jgi:hypothetical protein
MRRQKKLNGGIGGVNMYCGAAGLEAEYVYKRVTWWEGLKVIRLLGVQGKVEVDPDCIRFWLEFSKPHAAQER